MIVFNISQPAKLAKKTKLLAMSKSVYLANKMIKPVWLQHDKLKLFPLKSFKILKNEK